MTLSEECDPFQKVNSSILDLHELVTKAESMFDMTSCLHSEHIHTDTVCQKDTNMWSPEAMYTMMKTRHKNSHTQMQWALQ